MLKVQVMSAMPNEYAAAFHFEPQNLNLDFLDHFALQ
jgi:hypothetical protein